MDRLTGSVGHKGVNRKSDVEWVQILLNNYKISGITTPLKVDGKIGKMTIKRIETFQKNVLNSVKPDGRVNPGKTTFKKLKERNRLKSNIIFPLKFRPKKSTNQVYEHLLLNGQMGKENMPDVIYTRLKVR